MTPSRSPRAGFGLPAEDTLARARREWTGSPRDRIRAIVGRRSALRIPFDCPARWSTACGVDRFAQARDASESGAGLIVRAIGRPRVGERIRLAFELDEEHEWVLDAQAEVVRCDPRPDGLYDVGVRLGELAI
jgi:hypothetical protein